MSGPTYCNDGAMGEPWTLADFDEANSDDESLTEMHGAIAALGVGESLRLGGGAVAETKVTRLS